MNNKQPIPRVTQKKPIAKNLSAPNQLARVKRKKNTLAGIPTIQYGKDKKTGKKYQIGV